jgi:hypothetical protein
VVVGLKTEDEAVSVGVLATSEDVVPPMFAFLIVAAEPSLPPGPSVDFVNLVEAVAKGKYPPPLE